MSDSNHDDHTYHRAKEERLHLAILESCRLTRPLDFSRPREHERPNLTVISEKELTTLRKQLEDKQKTSNDLKRQLANTNTELDARIVMCRSAKCESYEQAKLKAHQESEEYIDELTHKCCSLKETIERLNEDLEEQKGKANLLAAALQREQRTLDTVMGTWKQRVARLSLLLETSQNECKDYATELTKLRSQYKIIQDENESIRCGKIELRDEIKDLIGGSGIHNPLSDNRSEGLKISSDITGEITKDNRNTKIEQTSSTSPNSNYMDTEEDSQLVQKSSSCDKGPKKETLDSSFSLRPYKCKSCGKHFKSKTHLVRHKRIHLEKKSYLCEVCHLSFNRRNQLTQHMLAHTSQHQFVCDSCGKSFDKKHSFRRHRRWHFKQLDDKNMGNRCSRTIAE